MLESGIIHFWPCRFYTLLQQQYSGERPHAAGSWCKRSYHFAHRGEINIAHDAALRQFINTDIDDYRTRSNHVPCDHKGVVPRLKFTIMILESGQLARRSAAIPVFKVGCHFPQS